MYYLVCGVVFPAVQPSRYPDSFSRREGGAKSPHVNLQVSCRPHVRVAMRRDILSEAEGFVRGLFSGDSSGHDVWHTLRVYRTAMHICDSEPEADREAVALAAILHDADDRKLGGDGVSLPNAGGFLRRHGISPERTSEILGIISQVSFKASDSEIPDTVEGKIVQDADRLDAIGAIGVARAFAYGGAHNRPMRDPDVRPRVGMDDEEYRKGSPDTYVHFEEKLLLLKEMMNTPEGRRLADSRHAFMESFLEEFDAEWDGSRRPFRKHYKQPNIHGN